MKIRTLTEAKANSKGWTIATQLGEWYGCYLHTSLKEVLENTEKWEDEEEVWVRQFVEQLVGRTQSARTKQNAPTVKTQGLKRWALKCSKVPILSQIPQRLPGEHKQATNFETHQRHHN